MKELVQSRVEPADLKSQLDAGEPVYIVDLRHPLELLPDPFTLPGAVHFSPDGLAERHAEIPRDRDIVLFCTCPSEATAAKTAMTLYRLGIERVRPLRGGYDEWKRLGYPVDAVALPKLPLEPARDDLSGKVESDTDSECAVWTYARSRCFSTYSRKAEFIRV